MCGEPANDTDRRFLIGGGSFDNISCPSRIIPFNSPNATMSKNALYILNIQIVLNHLLHCMRRHIIQTTSDFFSDSSNCASWHRGNSIALAVRRCGICAVVICEI